MQKIIKNFREGKNYVLECFVDDKDLHEKHLELWQILVNPEKHLSTPGDKTLDQKKGAAEVCALYKKRFLVLFKCNMT